MPLKKQVSIIQKVRQGPNDWRFIYLEKIRDRYLWDKRPGPYYLEWWEGKKRRRELAGHRPNEALEAQRRKRNELLGELLAGGKVLPKMEQATATAIADASSTFLDHVKAHSPDKPKTLQRYRKVLEHFERVLGNKKYVEAITRADIDYYKIKRSQEFSQQHPRPITPRTINFEVCVVRTFYYYLINDRGLPIVNPCAHFKHLKDEKTKAHRKPATYTPEELDRLLASCNAIEKTAFATLLLTGLRDQEFCYLTWPDVDLREATIKVTSKQGFSPKDYEERVIPIPPDLLALLKELPKQSQWVFPSPNGGRMTHLLRRLKAVAKQVGVPNATLHKFRHTYATRLLESGCDIVTVQHLMGHSDLKTTRQYLNPHEDLKRKAVNRLSLSPSKEIN